MRTRTISQIYHQKKFREAAVRVSVIDKMGVVFRLSIILQRIRFLFQRICCKDDGFVFIFLVCTLSVISEQGLSGREEARSGEGEVLGRLLELA